ncbi:MAG: VTT domain-containing protein [Verrucomicrobia bacterium]|nr:VTT domain-containing protein [Verrucomicrobiota bacterium]
MVPQLQARAGAIYARHPRKAIVSGLLAVALGIVLIAAVVVHREWVLASVQSLRAWSIASLQGIPLSWYLLAMILTPAFGAPLSIFYVTVATVAGGPLQGVVYACVAVFLNMALSYALAAYLCRPLLQRVLLRLGYSVPKIRQEIENKVIVIVRVSPLPFVVQNYSLGIARVKFWPYLWISGVIQAFWAIGMVLLADSFFQRILATGYFRSSHSGHSVFHYALHSAP